MSMPTTYNPFEAKHMASQLINDGVSFSISFINPLSVKIDVTYSRNISEKLALTRAVNHAYYQTNEAPYEEFPGASTQDYD